MSALSLFWNVAMLALLVLSMLRYRYGRDEYFSGKRLEKQFRKLSIIYSLILLFSLIWWEV